MSDECRSRRADEGRTCIHDFAGGWILAGDLCPACTTVLMDALTERAPGGPLSWHQNFRERANADR